MTLGNSSIFLTPRPPVCLPQEKEFSPGKGKKSRVNYWWIFLLPEQIYICSENWSRYIISQTWIIASSFFRSSASAYFFQFPQLCFVMFQKCKHARTHSYTFLLYFVFFSKLKWRESRILIVFSDAQKDRPPDWHLYSSFNVSLMPCCVLFVF